MCPVREPSAFLRFADGRAPTRISFCTSSTPTKWRRSRFPLRRKRPKPTPRTSPRRSGGDRAAEVEAEALPPRARRSPRIFAKKAKTRRFPRRPQNRIAIPSPRPRRERAGDAGGVARTAPASRPMAPSDRISARGGPNPTANGCGEGLARPRHIRPPSGQHGAPLISARAVPPRATRPSESSRPSLRSSVRPSHR